MTNLNYVIQGDRISVITEKAKKLNSGQMSLGDSVNMMDEIIELKSYFSSFYGEASKEFSLAKAILNIVRMMNRSIRIQKEPISQTVAEWVEKYPQRICYIKRVANILQQ
jgi:hypothetical protein